MGCIVKCGFKIILIAMSIAFVLAGIFLIIFGFFSLLSQNTVVNMLNVNDSLKAYYQQLITFGANDTSFISNMGIALIVMGFVMFGLGFLAWMGGCCGCRLCLLAFAISMMVVLAVEIAVIVIVATQPSKFQNQITENLYNNLDNYDGTGLDYDPSNGNLVESVYSWDTTLDNLQIENQCCGSHNYTDWLTANTTWTNNYTVCTTLGVSTSCSVVVGAVVPLSCCKTTDPSAAPTALTFIGATGCLTTANVVDTYTRGCDTSVTEGLNSFASIIIAVSAVAMVLEVANIISSCYVFKHTGLIL